LPNEGQRGRVPGSRRRSDILGRVCGRYTLTSPPARIAEQFHLPDEATAALRPRYNVAPGQPVPVVSQSDGRRDLELLHWGLRGVGAPGAARPPTPINARIESAADVPAFRDALARGRCLVPADGFFEWRKRAGGPEPHWIALPDRALFAFAGLAEQTAPPPEGDAAGSVAILTRPARGRLRELHERMPVLLAPDEYAAWLDLRLGPGEALARCTSRLSERLAFLPVGARVNDVRFDDPACLEPSAQLAWF
jgi:putative SOS response-associated peptidase YedK